MQLSPQALPFLQILQHASAAKAVAHNGPAADTRVVLESTSAPSKVFIITSRGNYLTDSRKSGESGKLPKSFSLCLGAPIAYHAFKAKHGICNIGLAKKPLVSGQCPYAQLSMVYWKAAFFEAGFSLTLGCSPRIGAHPLYRRHVANIGGSMKKILLASAFALTLSACANSALIVEKPNTGSYRTSSALVQYGESNVAVDAENVAYTQKQMEEAFFGGDNPLFDKGDGITVTYRYIAFDEGSQVARYLVGPIAGGSKVLLEVDFSSPQGEVLATVRGEGSVSGGFFGGSNKSGIKKAIKKIADFAAAEFHK